MDDAILSLALLIILARFSEEVASRLRQPLLVGHILAGVILGPAVLGVVKPSPELRLFIDIGIYLMFFLAGFEEIDIPGLLTVIRRRIFYASLLAYVIPLAVMFIILAQMGFGYVRALALASVVSMSSLGVITFVLMELGMLKNPIGLRLFSVVAIVEFMAILSASTSLEFITENKTFTLENIIIIPLKVIAFFTVGTLAGLYLVPKILEYANRLRVKGITYGLIFGLLLLFVYFAEVSGLHGTIGALLFGAVLSPMPSQFHLEVNQALRGISHWIFIPIFFAGIGMFLDLSFTTVDTTLLVSFIFVMTVVRFLSGFLAAHLGGMEPRSLISLGLLSKGGIDLAFMLSFFEAGIIYSDIFSLYILVTIFIVVVTPVVIRYSSREIPREEKQPELMDFILPMYIRMALSGLKAGDAMDKDIPAVGKEVPAVEFLRQHVKTGRSSYLVMDGEKVVGVISIHQVGPAPKRVRKEAKVIDLAVKDFPRAFPEEDLYSVVEKMTLNNISIIPVVSPDEPDKPLGVISRSDILKLLIKPTK
ncbi:MAG TPA: CBS domain-containing protein [Aigarchaeota archaeon]|nr:CBS domain-containing protein [Aigarchaeota archaeon]